MSWKLFTLQVNNITLSYTQTDVENTTSGSIHCKFFKFILKY